MSDNSNLTAITQGVSKTKSSLSGLWQVICQNVTPIIVGYLVGHFPQFNESFWFEIVVFGLAALNSFYVWFSWRNLITWLGNAIKEGRWGIDYLRQMLRGNSSAVILLPLAAAALICALAGCTWIAAVLQPNPNIVATLEASLATAASTAVSYEHLAACGSQAANGSKFCSDKNIVKQIHTAIGAAAVAVAAARANETASTITAAQNAISAVNQIVNIVQPTTVNP